MARGRVQAVAEVGLQQALMADAGMAHGACSGLAARRGGGWSKALADGRNVSLR